MSQTKSMITLRGKGMGSGSVMGRLAYIKDTDPPKNDGAADKFRGAEYEHVKFERALSEAREAVTAMRSEAVSEIGEEIAWIFEMHSLILSDPEYLGSCRQFIDGGNSAARSVRLADDVYRSRLARSTDVHIRALYADISDVSARLTEILTGPAQTFEAPEHPYILVCDCITPSALMALDRSSLLGIICEFGWEDTGAAQLAQAFGIPSVVIREIPKEARGENAILDADEGELYIYPDLVTVDRFTRKIRRASANERMLGNLKKYPCITKRGLYIPLLADVRCYDDIDRALDCGADGVGLMHSEYLYLAAGGPPDEETLFDAYRCAAEKMSGRRVIIKAFTVERPVVLSRSLRSEDGGTEAEIYVMKSNTLRTQLRAVFRASVYGSLALAVPGAETPEDIMQVLRMADDVCCELEEERHEFSSVMEIGAILQSPAAAVLGDLIARKCDFTVIDVRSLYNSLYRREVAGDPCRDAAVIRLLDSISANKGSFGIILDDVKDEDCVRSVTEYAPDWICLPPTQIGKAKQLIRESD